MVVLGLLAIAAVRLLADRIGVAAPLLLVLVGVAVSLLPGVPVVEIEPEWILAGILPPLLFSSAVAMPAMEFRRAFEAVSGRIAAPSAASVPPCRSRTRRRLEMIEAQRAALLSAHAEGVFTAEALNTSLENLDAEQISIELRSRSGDEGA